MVVVAVVVFDEDAADVAAHGADVAGGLSVVGEVLDIEDARRVRGGGIYVVAGAKGACVAGTRYLPRLWSPP